MNEIKIKITKKWFKSHKILIANDFDNTDFYWLLI